MLGGAGWAAIIAAVIFGEENLGGDFRRGIGEGGGDCGWYGRSGGNGGDDEGDGGEEVG